MRTGPGPGAGLGPKLRARGWAGLEPGPGLEAGCGLVPGTGAGDRARGLD